MRGRVRIFTLLVAAVLWLSCPGALAEFSPRYEQLFAGDHMTLEISGQLNSLSTLSSRSLEIVNGWLEGLTLRVSAGKNDAMAVLKNGERLISAFVERQAGYTLTAFQPSGGAYLTNPDGPDALQLIAGETPALPDLTVLPALYGKAAPAMYAALENYVTPKKMREHTSIKNANASTSYMNYLFPDGKLNEAWPEVLEAILPYVKEAFKAQPDLYEDVEGLLKALTFSDECRFKRFLDKEGNELGFQFTGKAERDGDKRKVTMYGGWTPDKGGYFSVNLAGVGSKNSMKGSLSVKLTAKQNVTTLDADGSLDRVMNGRSTAYTLNAALKNEAGEEQEHWTGKISCSEKEHGIKSAWTLWPDMTFTENGLEGDVSVQRKTGSDVTLEAKVHALLTAGEAEGSFGIHSAKDLRGLTAEKARASALSEVAPLTGALAPLVAELNESERTLLLHELRTDAWMNGPSVPVPDAAEDNWVVEEDDLE